MPAHPDPRILGPAAQPDPRSTGLVREPDPARLKCFGSGSTVLGLAEQHDLSLLAHFGSVLGLTWQPDLIAFGRGDNAPNRNS
jgi:hypothetical protein